MSVYPPEQNPNDPASGANLAPDSASGAGGGDAMPPLPPPPDAPPAAPLPTTGGKNGGGGMLSNLRVSLMPSDLEGRPAPNLARGLLLLGIVLAAETIVIGVLYFIVSRGVTQRVNARDALIALIDQQNRQVTDAETKATPAVTYMYQLANARETLNGHVYWTEFFSFLERNTLTSIQYRSFTADAYSGSVSVDGIGLTYRDVAQQIVSLRQHPLVADVRSMSAAADIDETGLIKGVSFSMLVTMKPQAWLHLIAESAPTPPPAVPAVPTPAPVPTTPVPTTPEPTTPAPTESTPTTPETQPVTEATTETAATATPEPAQPPAAIPNDTPVVTPEEVPPPATP